MRVSKLGSTWLDEMATDREELKRRVRERLRGKPKPERKLPWRPVAGVITTVAAFAIVLAVLDSVSGAPDSWVALAVVLGVASLAAMFAGAQAWHSGWVTGLAVALPLALAASTAVLGVPWRIGGETGAVRFNYRAMFVYAGPENGEPLNNLRLKFAAPQIENEFAGKILGAWRLYYIEDDDTLTLQANSAGVFNLRGSRTSQLGIIGFGLENSSYGPSLTWDLECLYPREIFVDYGYTDVSQEKADKVTLRGYHHVQEDWSWGYWHTYEAEANPENWRIDFSFEIGLYRENVHIQLYEGIGENRTWGAFSLPRTV